MKIKTLGAALIFFASTSAMANPLKTIEVAITKTTAANKSVNAAVPAALKGLVAATLVAKVASVGTEQKIQQITEAVDAITASSQESSKMSDKLRIETLTSILITVLKSDDPKVVNLATGKAYTAVVSPDAQGSDDPLDVTAVENFNKLLNSVIASESDVIGVKELNDAVAKADYIAAKSLDELEPCFSLTTGRR